MKISPRIIIYVLCFLLLAAGFLVTLGFKEAKQCMGNPFTYGADKLESEKTGDLHCTCSFSSPDYAPFYFDNEEVKTISSLPLN